MTVVVVAPAALPPVSVEEVKAHLRVDGDDDNPLLEGYVAAAAAWLDGPGGWLGRSLVDQTLELRTGGFPTCGFDEIDLPYGPVSSIVSITYSDPDGADQVMDPADYRLAGGFLAPAHGLSWPAYRAQREALRVRYVAGYGEDPDAVPAPIRQAILLLVGQWYAAREAVGPNDQAELPFAVSALLSPYRVWRV